MRLENSLLSVMRRWSPIKQVYEKVRHYRDNLSSVHYTNDRTHSPSYMVLVDPSEGWRFSGLLPVKCETLLVSHTSHHELDCRKDHHLKPACPLHFFLLLDGAYSGRGGWVCVSDLGQHVLVHDGGLCGEL